MIPSQTLGFATKILPYDTTKITHINTPYDTGVIMYKKVNWKDEQNIRTVCSSATSLSEVCRTLGIIPQSNIRTLNKYIKLYDIDISHFNSSPSLPAKCKIPLNEILTKNSTYSRWHLKNRLIEEGIIPIVCDECGLTKEWNKKPLTLHLDHINGDNTDNRLNNLRLLCPNCHSQTSTFAGRNKGK